MMCTKCCILNDGTIMDKAPLQNEIVKHNTTTLRNAKSVLPPKVFQGRMSVVHILK